MILTRKTTTKLNMLRKTSNSPSQQLLFLRTTTYDYFITIIISNITISNITIFTIFIFFVITNTNVVIFIIILSTVDVSTIKFSNFCYLFIYLFYFILLVKGFLMLHALWLWSWLPYWLPSKSYPHIWTIQHT